MLYGATRGGGTSGGKIRVYGRKMGRTKKKYEDFARDQVSEEKIQLFIDITS